MQKMSLIIFLLCCILCGCIKSDHVPHEIFNYPAPCIIPYHGYTYLTCHAFVVIIDGDETIVPANYQTDLASIPRFYWSILAPDYSEIIGPAILHDYLYECPGKRTRQDIDWIFYDYLIKNGISYYTAYKIWAAVRIFGGSHFQNGNNCGTEEDRFDTGDQDDRFAIYEK